MAEAREPKHIALSQGRAPIIYPYFLEWDLAH